MSRIAARPRTGPADPPRACRNRHRIAGQCKHNETADHDRFATKPVGQGPTDQLGDGEPGHVQAQGQLHLISSGSEIGADLWQCRQIHVRRQWPKGYGGGK